MATDQLADRPRPILVLGMHRSGTSAVSRLLHRAGINMGWRQDANAESRFFLRVNRWLLSQCGATWATVEPLSLLTDADIAALAEAAARRFRSTAALEHFGRGPRDQAWGLKDPRLSLLFPIYDRALPDARVVIVTRHGVDVAESLAVRARASKASIGTGLQAPVFGVRQPRSNRLQNAVVASDLGRNFDLWVRYQQALQAVEESIESPRVHRLRFEDLVDDTGRELARLSDFVGAQVSDIGLDSTRAYAHESTPELAALASGRADDLRAFGY